MVLKYEDMLRREWNEEKNKCTFDEGLKDPDAESWWKCSKGHEWPAKIISRNKKGSKCPYCAGRKAIKGVNDVAFLYPHLVKEFHPTKNGNRKLEDYKENSPISIWWICKKGHEWPAKIYTRTKRGLNCSVCSNNKTVPGTNDFVSLYPDIAKEVAPFGNEGIDIHRLSGKSSTYLKWICPKGHIYPAQVAKRTARGDGCPYCSGRYAIAGENDLETLKPEIKKYWDFERNSDIHRYKPSSKISVFWKCPEGHQWENKIANQVNYNECPYCSGKYLVAGKNDVASVYPELVPEWDVEMNKAEASQVKASTSLYAHWICSKGHRWGNEIYNRLKGENCPFCAGKRPIIGENDLTVRFPFTKEEWNYELNRKRPEEYLPKSNTSVWWKCENGHKYKMRISDKVKGAKCKECRKLHLV